MGISSLALLFLGFFTNCWQVADQQWFATHQLDMESHIVARMVKSRQDGVFSDGGLPGLGHPETTPASVAGDRHAFQTIAYTNGLTFAAYVTYKSQIGGQGMLFSILDRLIPISPDKKLVLFHGVTSLLLALTLTAVILWFHWEFGLLVALFVLASLLSSQWLVVFGRNLWWSMWAFYLPLAAVAHYLGRNSASTGCQPITLGLLVFVTFLVKCLFNGYEYVTTTVVMLTVPLVYYGIRDQWNARRFLRSFLAAASGSALAILLSFAILCIQIASVEGHVVDGVNHIVYSFQKRTHGDSHSLPSDYAASLDARTAFVVVNYLKGTFFDANNYLPGASPFVSRFLLKVRYAGLIALFLGVSGFLCFRRSRCGTDTESRRCLALICANWFSLLAPLSWLVIFKAHSDIHGHMNYIVWQMPFTLFGFALCGLVATSILSDLIGRTRPPN